MAKAKEYTCQYCSKTPIIGYRAHRDHESRCPFNPKNIAEPETEAKEPEMPVITGAEQSPEFADDGTPPEMQESKISEALELQQDPPGPEGDDTKLSDSVINLIDARIGFMMTQLEGRLETRDKEYGDQFNAALSNLPQIIDQAVAKYISGAGTTPDGVSNVPAIGESLPPATPPSKSAFNFLGGQIDVGNLISEYVKSKGGGSLEKGIINLLTGQANKKPRATDAKYSTRGMNNMSAMLRMKGADPVAMAIAHKSQAEQMLKENIPAQMRDYYIGQKSQAEAFLSGVELQKSYQSAADTIINAPPAEE